ncbi:fungal-specific transcription factor domain protein [Periconia macrospinosa]|uniref:Fungal-specific transcription factor domain protein n=1 Tax=Periconia macrospinosa TaxID=97972 RepID=A0A2V1DZ03_9PLEO|nr:fungal-specific transcription factor domain protein [Periconia macrospinosa]
MPGPPGTSASVQTRINQLESLVLDLMHKNNAPNPHPSSLQESLPIKHVRPAHKPREAESECPVSPSPSDYGSISIRHARLNYVGSSHWAAILDSIVELRNHFAQEEGGLDQTPDSIVPPTRFPKPQLLYSGSAYETTFSIIKSVPPRPVVDRLVSRYFNVLDIAPGVVHSTQFLRELQQASLAPPDPLQSQSWTSLLAPENPVDVYRAKTVQCLLLGNYTMGGPYTLETLILYFLVECFNLKDMEIGIWVLSGTIMRVAVHMGYHRDAKHFLNISPFAGEMRRRVWATLVQLDFSISTQLGVPTLIKESQTDTEEPRNLYDADFDENTNELPQSRPETEVTPTLYLLAKLRLISVGLKVADVAAGPRTHSYTDVLELDRQIREARNALPSSLKWNGLGTSLDVSSQIIIQRIWLEVTLQQLTIVLHKKFLDPSRLHPNYRNSRIACRQAAMKILELQRLVNEETQADGLLYQSRWRVSSAFSNDFLLATSILCYCLQSHTERHREQSVNSEDIDIEPAELDKIRLLLDTSRSIWIRQSAKSRKAQKAVAAVQYVLSNAEAGVASDASDDGFSVSSTGAAISNFPDYRFALLTDGIPDFTSHYDFLGLDVGTGNQTTAWPAFAPNIIGNVEQWP